MGPLKQISIQVASLFLLLLLCLPVQGNHAESPNISTRPIVESAGDDVDNDMKNYEETITTLSQINPKNEGEQLSE